MRLALAQMNSVVGDLAGNRDRILELLARSREAGADLALFPELAVTGYPPEDLLLRPAFVRAARHTVEEIAARSDGTVALVGAGRSSGHRFLEALGAALFFVGVAAFFRWRAKTAKVLDSEDKTPREGE